jgi:hypothetical protein
MKLTENWWRGEIDWTIPSGQLLQKFLSTLPKGRAFHITLFGSAPLQLTVDRNLLSGDVDLFSNDDEDLEEFVRSSGFGKELPGLHIESSFELSFRTSPRWRLRAKVIQLENVTLTIPHPIDILIGKLDRLAPKDLEAFQRVIERTGHPTADELKRELQNAVDLFSPGFDESAPNRYLENTQQLWLLLFKSAIDARQEIIEPALARRKQGYGETPPDYKCALGEC